MNQTPSIPDYVEALRRRFHTIVVAGLATSVVFGGLTALIQDPKIKATYFVTDSREDELASRLGGPSDIVTEFDVQLMSGEVQTSLLQNYPKLMEDELIRVYTGDKTQLFLSVIDNNAETAAEMASDILDQAVIRHRKRFDDALQSSKTFTNSKIQELMDERDTVEASNSQWAAVQSFSIFSQILEYQQHLTVISVLELSTTRGINDPAALGPAMPLEQAGPVTYGVLGLVLGLMLAASTVALLRFFEPRILVLEDIERAGLPLRFVEAVNTPTGTTRQFELVGAATAMTANLAKDEARSIQVFGIDDDDRFADIALGLESAIGSLGFSVERLDLTLGVLETHEFVEQVRDHAQRATGLLIVYTASASGPASTPFAVGSNVDQTVLVGYCGKSRNSSIRSLLREFKASAIICDGVVLVNA